MLSSLRHTSILFKKRLFPHGTRGIAHTRNFEWSTEWIGSNDSDDGRLVVFLHGLLGNKRNVKSFAKSVCSSLGIPGLLMDVRGHGDSHIPNSADKTSKKSRSTFLDCVGDMNKTLHSRIPDIDERELIIMGHSMGGRIAMLYAVTQNVVKKPSHVWLLDTVPGRLSNSVQNVLSVAQQLVTGENTLMMERAELTQYLIDEHQFELGTAQWLATSYDPSLPRKFKFDLNVAFDLVGDFEDLDFMSCLEHARQEKHVGLHMVRGGANNSWETSNSLDIFHSWEREHNNRMAFSFHTLPTAGHWVHIDDPVRLLEAVESIHK